MIETMLKIENIQILESVNDWKEAIHVSVMPLVRSGYVEERYIQGIIDNTLLYGSYYVLAPEIALPHARPEQGVISKQLAITVLRNPIRFTSDGYDVRLLIVLAAENGASHLEALKAIAEIISDEQKVQSIIEAKTSDEVFTRFMEKTERE